MLYGLISGHKLNIIIKTFIYIISIIMPIVVLICEYKNKKIIDRIKYSIAKLFFLIGNKKSQKVFY